MHLAEKFGAFLPTEPAARAECLSWLFWQMGSTPYVGGGFGHFYAYAPVKIEYAIDRFTMETKRLLDVLDKPPCRKRIRRRQRLHDRRHGDAGPWYGGLVKFDQYGATEFLARARIQERAALGRHDLRTPGREARAHGQPHCRRPVEPAARASRRQRLRDQKTQDKLAAAQLSGSFRFRIRHHREMSRHAGSARHQQQIRSAIRSAPRNGRRGSSSRPGIACWRITASTI